MHQLTSTVGIVALAAGAVAIVALLTTIVLAVRLSRVRSEQRVILGDGRQDLVAHAAELQHQFEALHGYVEDVAVQLEHRMATAEHRLDGAVAHSSLIRYDAYGEMSGRQSISLALLDSNQTGVVLSAIHHRDQARLYAKQIRAGQPEFELSPEEEEAVRTALAGGAAAPPGGFGAPTAAG